MNKQEFVNSVLAEPNVIKMLEGTEKFVETYGNERKGTFKVLLKEPQGGKNFRDVWFIENTETGDTDYQTLNTIDPKKNVNEAKLDRIEKYLESQFLAFQITVFKNENWAEADVYQLDDANVIKKKVLVYKPADNPITHKDVIVS